MTTKAKERVTKEKRGVSPSTIRSSSRSPRKSLSSLSNDHKLTTSSSQSDKRLPNYRRSTISSHNEPSKLSLKKNASEDLNQKPILHRRSFDKPPSASRVLKDRAITTRSSSFAPKTSLLPKPKLDRSLTRTNVSVKSPALSPYKNVKKSVLSTKESSSSRGGSSKVSNNVDVIEIKEAEKEVTVVDDVIDETAKMDSAVEIPLETAKFEIKNDRNDDDVLEIDNIEDGEIDLCDISTVSDDLNATQALLDDEFEKILQIQQTENNNHTVQDEQHLEETKVEVLKDVENPVSDVGQSNTVSDVSDLGQSNTVSTAEYCVDENKVEKEVVEEDKQVEGEEGVVVEEVKPEAAKRVAGGRNKKESPVYNDVIEETAGKLLEKRKNKVKALVGAFETVISLQEPDQA